MAKTSPTLVTFLLDRSGSMAAIRDDTIGAFNTYLDGLRAGKITFSFLQFDSMSIDTLVKNVPIRDVPALTQETFVPRGQTPLIDACYKTIKAVEEALTRRDDNPKVVICFQTDGRENASRQHSMAELGDLIKEKTALGWQFNFMGASIDAYAHAHSMGISEAQTMSYDSRDKGATNTAFMASSASTMRFASGEAKTSAYLASEKRAAKDAFDPDLKKHAILQKVVAEKIVDDLKL